MSRHFNTGNQNAKKAVTASKFIHVRVTPDLKDLIQSTARLRDLKESEFIINSVISSIAKGD